MQPWTFHATGRHGEAIVCPLQHLGVVVLRCCEGRGVKWFYNEVYTITAINPDTRMAVGVFSRLEKAPLDRPRDTARLR
jgi:hypothetical protein